MERWANLIRAAYQRSYYVREKSAVLKVKEDIVAYSKYTWPLLFSRFYEAFRLEGPPLPKNDVSLRHELSIIFFVKKCQFFWKKYFSWQLLWEKKLFSRTFLQKNHEEDFAYLLLFYALWRWSITLVLSDQVLIQCPIWTILIFNRSIINTVWTIRKRTE